MAARENQGLLIAVIILVLLTLVLALAAFLGLSKAGENATITKDTEHKLLLSKTLGDASAHEADILRAYLGGFGIAVAEVEPMVQALKQLAATQSLETAERAQVQTIVDRVGLIQANYVKDMQGSMTTEEGVAAQEPTWRSKIESLIAIAAERTNDFAVQRRQTELAEKEAASKILEMEGSVKAVNETLTDRNEELAETKKLGLQNMAELTSKLDEAVAGNETINKENQTFRANQSIAMQGLKNDMQEVEDKNQGLKTRINIYEREVFDRPDGQIVRVAARNRTCMINLGTADGLTANRTFSVYDQDVTNFDKGKHKAKIEVVRVFAYKAEAKITEEDPTNPILSGDHILTATWDPGFAVSIALAGVFDLDGDRYDDRDKLAQMIERNGGKIAATHDDEGTVSGKIDPTVRYLVLGRPPSLLEDADDNKKRSSSAITDAMQSMQAEAEKNTVELIDLQKLLNRMGVRAKPKTLQIEPGAGRFKPRTPSSSGAGN